MTNFLKHSTVDKIKFNEMILIKLTICHLIKFMRYHSNFLKKIFMLISKSDHVIIIDRFA